jgi:hypothetical protein
MTPLAALLLVFGTTAFALENSTMLILEVTQPTTEFVTGATTTVAELMLPVVTIKKAEVVKPDSEVTIIKHSTVLVESTTILPINDSVMMGAILETTRIPVTVVFPDHMQHDQPVVPPVIKSKTFNKTGKGQVVAKNATIAKNKTTPAIRPETTTGMTVTRLVVQAKGDEKRNRRQFIGGMPMGGMGIGGMGMGMGGFAGGMPVGGAIQSSVSQPFGFGGPIVQDTVTVEDTVVG